MELTQKILILIFLFAAFPSLTVQRRIRPRTRPPVFAVTRKPSPTPTPSGKAINEKECSRIVDNLNQPRFDLKFNKVSQVCVRRNESELLNKLKDVGGFNPRYMAINREDACRFQDLSGNEQPMPMARKSSLYSKGRYDQPLDDEPDTEMSANHLNDLQDEIESLGNHGNQHRQKRMVTLSPGSIDRGCWSRGSTVDGTTLVRLCTECAASTKLPASVFPPFINEVICGDADRFCFGPIGRCAQKVIKFTFLRRTGNFEKDDDLSRLFGVDVYVEEWEEFEQDIRSCCECRLFSFLANRG